MLTIKNIRIVDDTQDFVGDINVENGKIVAVGQDLPCGDDVLDFSGKSYVLVPSFTDLHTHFRDPGFTYKEDLETGSRAALHGGYTAVNLMPNTRPICCILDRVKEVESRAQALDLITVNQTLSMTKDLAGEEFSHLATLEKQEVLFVTDDGKGVNNDEVMKYIFEICRDREITIMQHAEDSRFSKTDMREAENRMTFRDIELFSKIGGHLHFCHVSTKEAIAAIAQAQAQGMNVTCEVTPHHLFSTGDEAAHYRVNPPLREPDDIDALISAIQQDVVCAIATDHAPHSDEDKANGSPGMIGIEQAFALCYTSLVKSGKINLQKLISIMSTQPSQMMKLNKGKIAVGLDADFAIVEIDTPYILSREDILSKSKNTPFIGREVYGKILKTIRLGKVYNW